MTLRIRGSWLIDSDHWGVVANMTGLWTSHIKYAIARLASGLGIFSLGLELGDGIFRSAFPNIFDVCVLR